MGEAGFWLQQPGGKECLSLGTLQKDEGLQLGAPSEPRFPSTSSNKAGLTVGVLFHQPGMDSNQSTQHANQKRGDRVGGTQPREPGVPLNSECACGAPPPNSERSPGKCGEKAQTPTIWSASAASAPLHCLSPSDSSFHPALLATGPRGPSRTRNNSTGD